MLEDYGACQNEIEISQENTFKVELLERNSVMYIYKYEKIKRQVDLRREDLKLETEFI